MAASTDTFISIDEDSKPRMRSSLLAGRLNVIAQLIASRWSKGILFFCGFLVLLVLHTLTPSSSPDSPLQNLSPIIDSSRSNSSVPSTERQSAVKAAFLHGWHAYEKKCWGQDEIDFTSKGSLRCENWVSMGLTIVDSLDALLIMGLDEEFAKARNWVVEHFVVADKLVSFFETVIRVFGGFLSAFEITQDKVFLDKATEIGDALFKAFDSPSGLPYPLIQLKTGASGFHKWMPKKAILAEVGSVQLEYAVLSQHTGNPEYAETAFKVFDMLDRNNGLYPMFYDINTGASVKVDVSMGAMGDSYYEYLLKSWILTGKSEDKFLRLYKQAMADVIKHLVVDIGPDRSALLELKNGKEVRKMDHLACFFPGMLTLGVIHEAVVGSEAEQHTIVAKKVMNTCIAMYRESPTGLSPESIKFTSTDFRAEAKHYMLRPETVESLFLLWRLTGDETYREAAWDIFQAIETHCKTPEGYRPKRDVTRESSPAHGKMESFFLAETLKYLYLIFDDNNTFDLMGIVFNTEAHPLKVFPASE